MLFPEKMKITILFNSGYFFTVSAYYVASSKGENYVNVIIEVTEGFLLRFGGGSIFGIFGKDNLFGLRKGYLIAAGYNLDGIKYYDNLLFNSNFFFNIRLFYQNSFGFTDIFFNKVDFEIEAGYRLKPNFSFSLITFLGYQDSNIIEEFESYFIDGKLWTFKQGIKIIYNYYYFLNKENKSDFYLRGEFLIYPSIVYFLNNFNQNSQIIFNDLIYVININKILMLETKYFSCGFSTHFFYSNKILDYFNSYNLAYSEFPFIRATVSKVQSYPDLLLVTNFEIRSPEILIPFGSIFNFVFSIFIFDDFAFCKFEHKDPSSLPYKFHENNVQYLNTISKDNFYFLNGAGIGIRFGFSMPVNVYFTLTYGINLNRTGSFTLYYGKGF